MRWLGGASPFVRGARLGGMSDDRSFSARAMTAGTWVIAGKLIARSIDFVTLLVLARLLDPADFGLVAMAMAIILIVEAVLQLPIIQALVRVPDLTPPMFDTAFTLGLLRGLSVALLLGVAAWPISVFYEEPRLVLLILALALAPVVRGMISPRMAIFMQRFDFRREVALDLVGKVSSLAVAATVAAATGSYWAIAAGTVTTPVVMVACSYVFAPQWPRLTLAEWPIFADIVGWNSISQAISALNWQMDKVLLGRFAEISVFGRFVVADNLASIPQQAVVFPLMRPLVAAFAPSDPRRLASAYYKATAGILLITAPTLVTIALLADPAVRIVLGDKWTQAAPILRWLALCNLLALPVAAMPPLVIALGRTRFLALRSFLEFCIGLPALVVGVIYFGVFGAIGARAAAGTAAIVAVVWMLNRLIGATSRGLLTECWRAFAALLPLGGFLLLAASFLAELPSDWLLIAGTVGAGFGGMIIYFAATLMLWGMCGRPEGAEAIAVRHLKSIFAPVASRHFP